MNAYQYAGGVELIIRLVVCGLWYHCLVFVIYRLSDTDAHNPAQCTVTPPQTGIEKRIIIVTALMTTPLELGLFVSH